jgi:hypothetical protein
MGFVTLFKLDGKRIPLQDGCVNRLLLSGVDDLQLLQVFFRRSAQKI